MRVAAIGPVLGGSSQDAAGHNWGQVNFKKNSHDGTETGFAWRSFNGRTIDVRFREDNSTAITTQTASVWYRFWLRMKRYPQFVTDTFGTAAGRAGLMQGLTSTRASSEGGVQNGCTMDSGGFLGWLNHGNLGDTQLDHLYTSSFPLALDTWYKIEVFTHWGQDAGQGRVIISDANGFLLEDSGIITGGHIGAANRAGYNVTQNCYAVIFGDAYTSTNHGMEYDMCQMVVDNCLADPVLGTAALDVDDRIPDSRVTLVPVVAAGTYHDFTVGNTSVQARGIYNNSGGTEAVQFTGGTGGAEKFQTYRVKNLRECGITGPIYHFRIYLNQTASGAGNTGRAVLIVNGTIYKSPIDLVIGVQDVTFGFMGQVALHPDDVIEIGLVTSHASGNTAFAALCLEVDHYSPVAEIVTADFQVGTVEWTGIGGLGQTINLPFVPSFVIAWAKSTQPDPYTGGPAPGCFWWDTLLSFHYGLTGGPRRDQIRVVIDRQTNTAQLMFAGDYPEFNTNGIEYYALLVRDPTNRILARGCLRQVSQTTPFNTDNINYVLSEGTSTPGLLTSFTPRAMWLYNESNNTSMSQYARGPAQTGDASTPLGGGVPDTDAIQSFSTDGFQLGRVNAYQTNGDRQAFLAFRDDAFVSTKLFGIVTWKGSQASSLSNANNSYKRRIAVDLGGQAPEFIVMQCDAASPQGGRMWHAKQKGAFMQNFDESTVDGAQALDGEPIAAGQTVATNVSSTGNKVIKEVWFYLRKVGAPTGPMRVRIFPTSGSNPTGTTYHASSDVIDASTLTASYQWVRFMFTGVERFGMVRGTTYFASLEYVGTGANYVEAGQDQSGSLGAGNKHIRSSADVWSADAGVDLAHRVIVGAAMGWAQASYDQASIVDYENDAFYVEESDNTGVAVSEYAFANRDNAEALDGNPLATAETFTASASGTLATAAFMLRKVGIPTGNFSYKIYATVAGVPSGAALATSDVMNVADVSNAFFTTYTLEFTGLNQISIASGTVYAISCEYTGTGSDYLEVGDDRSAPGAAGTKYNFSGGVWSSVAGQDLVQTVAVFGTTNFTAYVFTVGLDALGNPPPGIWHEFLVAGHALKSIDAWYVGGVRQPISSAEGDPDTEAYMLVPGYSAYENAFGTLVKTRTYNGHLYTCIYLKEGGNSPLDIQSIIKNDTPLTINCQGIEDVGDGSGNLLTFSFDIYRHLMQNWVFGDYQSGSWLTTPAFDDSDALPVMLDSSFADAHSVSTRRITDGYMGGGAIGADGQFVSIRELIRLMNISCDCDSGLNRKCQFFVSMIDDSNATLLNSPLLTDVNDILKSTLDIEDDFSNHFNKVPFLYQRDYVDGSNTPWRVVDSAESAESINNYLETLTMNEQELHFTRDPATAEDIAARKLLRHKDPPRLVRWSLPAKGFNVELGDMRLLTDYGGVGTQGWVSNPTRVQKHIASPTGAKVDFEGYDMARLFATLFILGDEGTLVGLWSLAVGADAGDRLWGYLCDEVTGEFSDGSPGKRLR